MKINDLRCTIALLIDVIKKNALPNASNLKLYELQVAACIAWSFIQIREKQGLPFQAPFLSVTMADSLTGKEKNITGNTAEDFVNEVMGNFREKGIDFSLGFSDKDILDFQMKKVRSIDEIMIRLEDDQETYGGESVILGYYLDELTPENVVQVKVGIYNVRDVMICGFNKNKDEFTWQSIKDAHLVKVIPPWLIDIL